MRQYLFVGIGGMLGAMGRYGISLLFNEHAFFPWSTLVVNLVGSFLLTLLVFNRAIKSKLPPQLFTALTVGLIGSFTTFSAVTYETIELWQHSSFIAMGYVSLSFFGSLSCCYGAFLLVKRMQVKT